MALSFNPTSALSFPMSSETMIDFWFFVFYIFKIKMASKIWPAIVGDVVFYIRLQYLSIQIRTLDNKKEEKKEKKAYKLYPFKAI